MNNESQIKELVKEKYAAIAEQSQTQNATSCCGATSSCCGDEVYNIMADDYTKLEGYNPDADLAAEPAMMLLLPGKLWAKTEKYWVLILLKL
mgnify:CR=1 FL=1